MNDRIEQHLAHAENRIQICITNAAISPPDSWLGEAAREGVYKWIGLAQENHQEDHF